MKKYFAACLISLFSATAFATTSSDLTTMSADIQIASLKYSQAKSLHAKCFHVGRIFEMNKNFRKAISDYETSFSAYFKQDEILKLKSQLSGLNEKVAISAASCAE